MNDFPPIPSPDSAQEPSTHSFPEDGTAADARPPREPAWSGVDVCLIVIVTCVVMMVADLAGVFIWEVIAAANGRGELDLQALQQNLVFAVPVQAVGYFGGLLFAYFWIHHYRGRPFWRSIAWNRLTEFWPLLAIGGGIATAFVMAGLESVLPMPKDLPIDQMINNSVNAWVATAFGILIAPAFEEFLFRGLIYPSLTAAFERSINADEWLAWNRLLRILAFLALLVQIVTMWTQRYKDYPVSRTMETGCALAILLAVFPQVLLWPAFKTVEALGALHRPRALAIVITGILFGSLHSAQLGGAWLPLLMLSVVGMVITAVRAFSNSLRASWLFHCAYNGVIFVMLFIGSHGYTDFRGLTK